MMVNKIKTLPAYLILAVRYSQLNEMRHKRLAYWHHAIYIDINFV